MGAGSGYGAGRYSGKKCRLVSMFALTSAFFLVEIIVGYVTNSMALVADSFHMLSDIAALVIAFLSVRMAPKSWNKNTFGWARAEVLGALVNAVFLVALCFSITVESLKRFYEIEEIHTPQLILWVGVGGLVVNLLGLLLFHEHGSGHGHSHGFSRSTHSHLTDLAEEVPEKDGVPQIVYSPPEPPKKSGHGHGHSHGGGGSSASQMNMRGVFLHVMADALGSVIVIISAVIMWQTNWQYKNYVDPALSLVLVILILRSVWPLLMESALILLQTVPTHIEVTSLQRKLMEKVDGILAVHEFHIWQLAGDRIIASAHVRCLNLSEYMKIAEKAKEFFHNEGIHSTTIQPEFVETSETTDSISSAEDCMLDCPKGPTLTANTGCEASKCCPPPLAASRNPSTGQFPPQDSAPLSRRRPSSVSVNREAGLGGFCGLSATAASRRSAPNLSLDGGGSSLENTTIELTAELDLSDNPVPQHTSSANTSLAQDQRTEFTVGDDLSSLPPPPPYPAAGYPSSSWGTPSHLQEQDQGSDTEENTPMVARTKTRVVRVVSKQSNV